MNDPNSLEIQKALVEHTQKRLLEEAENARILSKISGGKNKDSLWARLLPKREKSPAQLKSEKSEPAPSKPNLEKRKPVRP